MVMKALIKMINNRRDKDLPTKQEADAPDRKASGMWSGLKNPRIVRVSRTFGGKDRHSKVSTVRGLRDRRVRLSVPTAIQLYDLQSRLGVNQPSKVVDWLLNAAQEEIDKLPPLQIPSGSFVQIPPQSHDSLPVESFKYTNIDKSNEGLTAFPQSAYWEGSNAYLSQLGNRWYQAEAPPESQIVLYPPGVQMQMALQATQSNDTSDHLQLGGPSVRHFQ